VVLIHPPAISKRYLRTKFMPYGMAVLYAFLKEHGIPAIQHDFLIEYLFAAEEDIDYHNPEKTFSEQDFFSFIRDSIPHKGLEAFSNKYGGRLVPDAGIYAFSIVAYHQFWSSLILGRYIRNINPDAIIVFGGPFVTIKPAEFLVRHGVADFWIKGSGEIPLLKLYALLQGRDDTSLDHIPGLVRLNGTEVVQAPQSVLAAEEERPPDFEGLQLESYRYDHNITGENTLFLPYRISKGCPSRCSFCTGRLVDPYDHKSVDKIVAELLELSGRYQTSAFQFADAAVNGNPRLLADLCDRLHSDFPEIRWYSYGKVKGFDPQLLRKVRDAGCFALFWGVESAYQPTLELFGKNVKIADTYGVIDEAADLGIKNYIHIMFNTPHESIQEVEAFISLVERYIDSDQVMILPQRFLLEPQSLMFDHPERYGMASIRRVDTSPFEREQFIFEETRGADHSEVLARNERHRKALSYYLDLISFSNMLGNADTGLVGRWLPRVLAYLGSHSTRSNLIGRVYSALVRRMVSNHQELREQL
jgi:anaerobic magnesium-protoporphyrin IX monomethyl ester cyclase